VIIVFNPAAGRRRSQLLWRVLDVLSASGCRIEIVETMRHGHAEVLAREAAAKGARLVVAAGGDGTIAEVANGLTGSGASLGVIPLGTANVLAHELGLSFAPRSIAATLGFGRTRPLWPGLAHGPGGDRLFVQMLSIGFDASVVQHLSLPLKRMIGRGAYVCQTLRELVRYRFDPIRLRIDGEEIEAGGVIVTKGKLYGGHYMLAPSADTAAPGFSVVLFDCHGPGAALMYGAALPLNRLGRAPGVRQMRAARVDFMTNRPFHAQADGDAIDWMPLSVFDASQPIPVVVGL
jgi:diacylglycerol kinase family enzyme